MYTFFRRSSSVANVVRDTPTNIRWKSTSQPSTRSIQRIVQHVGRCSATHTPTAAMPRGVCCGTPILAAVALTPQPIRATSIDTKKLMSEWLNKRWYEYFSLCYEFGVFIRKHLEDAWWHTVNPVNSTAHSAITVYKMFTFYIEIHTSIWNSIICSNITRQDFLLLC